MIHKKTRRSRQPRTWGPRSKDLVMRNCHIAGISGIDGPVQRMDLSLFLSMSLPYHSWSSTREFPHRHPDQEVVAWWLPCWNICLRNRDIEDRRHRRYESGREDNENCRECNGRCARTRERLLTRQMFHGQAGVKALVQFPCHQWSLTLQIKDSLLFSVEYSIKTLTITSWVWYWLCSIVFEIAWEKWKTNIDYHPGLVLFDLCEILTSTYLHNGVIWMVWFINSKIFCIIVLSGSTLTRIKLVSSESSKGCWLSFNPNSNNLA